MDLAQGTHYSSWAFGHRLRAAGLPGSTGTIGDCFDDPLDESFLGTLQLELRDGAATAFEVGPRSGSAARRSGQFHHAI
jgi:transposase InsO family protein